MLTYVRLSDCRSYEGKEVYHIGASLKELGKKWFAFSKMDVESFSVLGRLK